MTAAHPSAPQVLVLGGTTQARQLVEALSTAGVATLTSLAGATRRPAALPGAVRTGGFGGVDGLTAFLGTSRFAAVVDATHPFAAQMSSHAAAACRAAGVPLLRFVRPGWADHPAAASWTWVDSLSAAKTAADEHPGVVFLSIGRQELTAFGAWTDRVVLVRTIEQPLFAVPPLWRVIRARGPFTVDQERRLFVEHDVAVLVTKDSGGRTAKLDVATERGTPVVIVRRPPPPPGTPGCTALSDAVAWSLRAAMP